MSCYCTISGFIRYEKQEDFDAALAVIESWYDMDYCTDECDERINDDTEPDINRSARIITIPLFLHRNLGYHLNEIWTGGKGRVVWTCTDGCFEAGYIIDGKETTFDLEKWAKENMEEENATPPNVEDFDAFCEWQAEVEQAFFEENT